jgi:membrane-bound lytic murein transglycosylase MltF
MLLNRHGGDVSLALAAYNGGPAHLDQVLASDGKRKMNPETYDYVQRITGKPLVIETHVTVNGAGDPKATAGAVAKAVNETNSAIIRNNLGAALGG